MENPLLEIVRSAASQVLPQLMPLLIFALVALFAFKFLEMRFLPKRRAWKGRRSGEWRTRQGKVLSFSPNHDAIPSKGPDAADQLRTVMQADFAPQPLLNKSEMRLFKALDSFVLEHRPDWQVMAQVSLGEILKSPNKDAYRCINSKRVDLLIVDENCRPLHAIEYQGGGHFKGAHATAARDAVKKEALRRAGIGYVEVIGGEMTAAELRQLVEKLVKAEIAQRR